MSSLIQYIRKIEPDFNKVSNGDALNFESECRFAAQQLMKNEKTFTAAEANRKSLYHAIVNVSAVGISLNPALAHAYLLPRDGAICLDISYRGLLKLATDTGVIKWARAQLVYEKDDFTYHGPAKEPEYKTNPFDKDRGDFVGAYCIAKTNDGDILTEVMTADEIYQVRDTSMAYVFAKNKNKTVWGKWFPEMAKKTIIKRASKTWPQSDSRHRLDKAIEVLNEHEGLVAEGELLFTDDQFAEYRGAIKGKNALQFAAINHALDVETRAALYTAYKKIWPGTVAELKEHMDSLLSDGIDSAENIAAEIEEYSIKGDSIAVSERIDELTDTERELVLSKTSDNAQSWINQNLSEAA